MESPGERDPAGPSGRPGRLAAQLAVLLVIGATLGAVTPRASTLGGLAGGFLAWVAVVASAVVRAWWYRSSRRRSHWSRFGAELVTGEIVRTGVALLVVLFVLAPLAFWAGLLPRWFLAAVTTGVATALPVGVAVELHAQNPELDAVADRRRLWRAAVVAVAVTALAVTLLAAAAGLIPVSRGLVWTAVALSALAVTAAVRVRVRRDASD